MVVPNVATPRSSLSPLNLEVLEQDEAHVLLQYGNVLLVLWSGTQQPEVCRALYDTVLRVARRSGVGKVAAASVIQTGTTAPSAKVREALARLIDDSAGVIHRSALIYPNDGFLASIVRSIALSLTQGASRRHGHQVFHRIDDALKWMTEGLPTASGQPISVSTLRQMLDCHLQPVHSRVA